MTLLQLLQLMLMTMTVPEEAGWRRRLINETKTKNVSSNSQSNYRVPGAVARSVSEHSPLTAS